MNRRGIVGIAVLWILAALSAMAVAAIAAGRLQSARGRAQLDETRALALLQAGLMMAREADFVSMTMEQNFDAGHVRLERVPGAAEGTALVRCTAVVGKFEKRVETQWRRSANSWRAELWREL